MTSYKDSRPVELNENGIVNCEGCADYDDCPHRDAQRRNPRKHGGLELCHRIGIKMVVKGNLMAGLPEGDLTIEGTEYSLTALGNILMNASRHYDQRGFRKLADESAELALALYNVNKGLSKPLA